MSGLGGSAQLRSAVGGSEHHLPVTSSSSLVNNLYAPAHHQPSSHHHNNQFLYGNGDLAALQSSQFRNDIFSPELNWQQQHQQHHQLTTQSYQPQHFNTSTTLPEHHTFPDPASSHLQPFSGQLSTNGWPSSLGDPTGFTQHESTISPAQISNNFTNARPLDDNERPASTLNTYPQVKQSGQFVDFAAPLQPSSGVATAFTMINGCPHVSLHYCDEFQDAFEAIEALGYLGEPATSAAVPNKKPRLSTPASVPSPAAAASPSTTPGASKSVSKPPPAPKSKVPVEPLAKLKYLLQECLDTDDDDEEASDIAAKAWGIIADVTAEQSDLIAIAVSTILKVADDETLVYMGKILQFTMRLRKWVVAEHNKDKKSPMIPKMLKLLSQIRLPLEMYEKQQWDKVLNAIHRKSELDKSREFANQIMTRFQHLEKERARKEREAKKVRSANTDKQKAVTSGVVKKESSSSLNTGVKRTIEEVGKGTTASASKKVSLGDVRSSVSNPNIPKSAGPSVPAKNGTSSTSSSSAGDKKPIPSSAGVSTGPASSGTTATATAKPKPPASSGFFKTLGKSAEPAKAQSKVPEKKTSTQQTPSAPTTSFTSIFAQLQQRQKEQDREKKDAANKAADAARTSDEDKKKKKKTVKWKTGDDLVKVQIFEWQEPEGEYYGGGSGMAEHGWGDATGEGEALKNRNFIEEEEDLMEWYQPKPVDFDVLYRKKSDAKENPEKRGGLTVVESEEAKTQAQRELVTLAAFYNSPRDIPASPKEPDETADAKPEEPTEIPLPDEVKVRLGMPIVPALPISQTAMPQTTDLSSLLSAIQQPQLQHQQPQPQANPAQDILSTLQAIGQVQQQQPHLAAPQPPQLDLTSLLSAMSSQQQPPQMQQPQQQMQPNFLQNLMQPQAGQNPAAAVADLLARLTSGMATANPQAGFPAQTQGFPGIMPSQQQQQQQQPPTAPRAWNGSYDTQTSFVDQRDDRNGARDVRRELRDAVGWSDNDNNKETPAASGAGGNAGSGGGKWANKHAKKKEKKQKQADAKSGVLCLFFQKGNCKHGDSCRFSHDASASAGSSGGGGGAGGWKSGKKRHGGHVSRGVDQGAGPGAVGWPGAGELEY